MMNPWDKDNPLARCEGETKRANVALTDYTMMGPGRSLEKLTKQYRSTTGPIPPTRNISRLKIWSTRNDWQARVAAWEAIKREEAETEWSLRRTELCQIEWDKAQALLERAETMLKHPLVERTVDHEGQTVVVKPVHWRASDISRYLEIASKLMRLAAGMPEKHEHGFDDPTRRLLVQVGLLAAGCITDPTMRQRFEQSLTELMGDKDA